MKIVKFQFAFAAFLIFLACESQISPAVKLDGNNELVTKFNGHYHRGTVEVTSTGHNELFVGLNPSNNSFERMFILQAESFIPFEKSFESAELFFMHDALIINSLDEKYTLIVTVADTEKDLAYYNLLSSQVRTIEKVVTGYGLNNFTNAIAKLDIKTVKGSADLYKVINAQIIKKTKDISNAAVCEGCGDGTCLSGGCGSSECSYGAGTITCSVKCKDDYHACCSSPLVCKCRKDSDFCDKP